MIRNLLAWLAFALAMLFVILSITGLFIWAPPDGGTGRILVWFCAIPFLITSIVLVIALMIVSAFQSDS